MYVFFELVLCSDSISGGYYVRKKKNGRFKKRWILYAILGILIYFVIGASTPFAKYKTLQEDTINNLTHEEIFTSEGSLDRVMLLETNISAWEERIRLLNLAKERIVLSTFSIDDGESTRDLASILLNKADQGVKIYILVDGFNGKLNMEGSDLFYALSSHPNIEIKLYNSINPLLPWKTQGRMHDKYVLVDDIGYILGGRNTFDYFIGDYKSKSKSHDREVLVYNTATGSSDSSESSIWGIYKYFEDIWEYKECKLFRNNEKYAKKKGVIQMKELLYARYESLKDTNHLLFEEYDYASNTHEAEGIVLLSNPTGIYGKEPVVFYQLTELMKMAKERVVIHTPYAVGNTFMYDKLREVFEEVPDCKIMLNSVENGDNFFASSDYLRNKGDLLKVGIPVYEYDGGISYHGKSIVIDDSISIIGSYNFDLRSTYVDTELMLVIKSKGLTEELSDYMEEFETDCRIALTRKEYNAPEHVVVKEIPFMKKVALRIVGFVMQPFRYLL